MSVSFTGGALRQLQDFSLVGFDDIHPAEFATPRLTPVEMSQRELARIAFDAVMKDVNSCAIQRPIRCAMNPRLVLHDSTTRALRWPTHSAYNCRIQLAYQPCETQLCFLLLLW